jgi:hypothetical protein
MTQRVSHGFGQVRPTRHAWQVVFQPVVQILDQRSTSQLTNGLTHIGWLAADVSLDLIELGDACQHLGGER